MKQLFKTLLAMLLAIAAIAFPVAPALATGVFDLPQTGAGQAPWAIDEADVISRINEGQLNNALEKLEADTGKGVKMVALRRLDFDQTIDSFADGLFERWFPTPEAKANQTLIVIDTLTNKSVIRTGDAVKAIVPDEIAQSILQENLGLPVRQGNKYNEGFLSASDRLTALLSGQPDPGAPVAADNLNVEGTFAKAEESDTKNSTIWVIGFLLVATIVPMLTYYAYVGFPGR
ncbi:TPM domain-containing protein [Oscillatoria sp. FACHB-1406]|uniref:photosystem II repair protein Psb32 n=1 Tax=Oscillatoria sp. FACHB-1406 TaxID=2692846 RepID=UPI0016876CA2|nr:TPM domain-containing protein [Oscillatoria sp. FACHB-1406]MBD2577550.1 TPM domain-containing protein [Oscillatoria sp. FACHB-1406]